MLPPAEKDLHTLDDYVALLANLHDAAFDLVVIGGCAVGSYAHMKGGTVLSGDLDLYTDNESLQRLLEWAPAHGIEVVSRPQPRSIPTAFLRWRNLDINVLTRSDGLPDPDVALRTARYFKLRDGLEVAVIDPFDLLNNKLRVNRPKDRPHIQIMLSFVEEEVVAAFETETDPRARLGPARRYLRVTDAETLPAGLSDRLIPLARTPADFRFLVNRVPTRDRVEAIVERAEADVKEELRGIAGKRRFGRT